LRTISLSPVPLDGRARIVCVRADEEAPLLCPPLDLINGGLKAVPEEGNWDETDMPLMVSLERLEELISRGSETDMAYQFIDKYQKFSIKYIDPKTGQIVEGEYLAPSEEIVLPDIVPEKMNSIGEYDLDMEFIDPQGVYRMLIEGFMSNEEANGDYWRDLLNGNVNYDVFMNYLRNSVGGPENKNYWWPMTSPNGIDFKPYGGYYRSNNEISYTNKRAYGEGVYLDGFYYSFFTYSQYENSPVLNRFVDEIMKENYLNSLYPITNFNDFGSSFYKPNKFFGLLLKNNHFIFMIGSMALPGPISEGYEDSLIGFNNEGRIEDVDLKIVSSVILTYIKGMYDWSGKDRAENKFYCTTGFPLACDNGISYENTIPIVKFR